MFVQSAMRESVPTAEEEVENGCRASRCSVWVSNTKVPSKNAQFGNQLGLLWHLFLKVWIASPMKLFPSAKGIGFTVALCICQIITTVTDAEEVAPPKLEAVRKDETGFRIRVEGENAKKYLLEHSQDLVDWETLGEVTLDVGTSLEVLDADVAGGKKFYRASEVILSALQPGTAIILAGDVIILHGFVNRFEHTR